MFEKIYPWVTYLLILSGLFQTLLLPMGAITALLTLIAMTLFKVVLARAAAPVKNIVEKASGKSVGKETIKAAQDIKNVNIWALIVDYLFTPMNQTEQIFLILGWAGFPIALAGFVSIYFGGIAGIMCNAAWVDWCSLIKPIVDIFK